MTPAETSPEVPCGIYPALDDPPPARRTWLVVVAAAGIIAVGISLAFAMS